MIEITDTIIPGTITVEKHDVTEAIRPWFPDAPEEVTLAIDELQDRLNRSEDTYALAQYLGIIVREV